MRRLFSTLAAVCLFSAALGCNKTMHGVCDCDCCPYSCCGCYGCFEGCQAGGGCGCGLEGPTAVGHAGLPGQPVAYNAGYPVTYYPAAQPVYQPEYIKVAPQAEAAKPAPGM